MNRTVRRGGHAGTLAGSKEACFWSGVARNGFSRRGVVCKLKLTYLSAGRERELRLKALIRNDVIRGFGLLTPQTPQTCGATVDVA